MKKLTLFLLIAILLTACGPKPQDVVNAWQEALNKGDIDAALAYLADDATVTIIPPADGDGVYNGHAEIRGWYESLAAGKGVTTLSDCEVNGETVTCFDKYADEGLKAMGVDFIEGTWVAVISDGKIQSYTFTITPESLAKFPPPPTEPPKEVRITSAEEIIGKWEGKYLSNTLPHEFRADGLLIVSIKGKYIISKGQYWFEDGLLKMNDNEGDCAEMLGVYEVYATYEGDHATKLRFVLVGDDACESRKNTLAGGLLAVPSAPDSSSTEPPVAAPTLSPEAPISSVDDVIGVWGIRWDGDPYLMEFKADGFYMVGWEGNRTGLVSGKYAVVGNQLHFLKQDGSVDAIYEVYVTKRDGKPATLRFVVVGEDPEANRKGSLDGKTLKPAAP